MKKASTLIRFAIYLILLFSFNILVFFLINKFVFYFEINTGICSLESRIKLVPKSKVGHGKSFSLWNIQQLYQQLTVEQFDKIYSNLFPLGGEIEFLEDIYSVFEENGDRYVYILDLLCSLSLISSPKPERKLEWQFTWYDLNKDGYITQQEMLEIINALHEHNYSDSKVRNRAFLPERKIDQIINQLDKNMDCKLSLEEFIKVSESDRLISQLLLRCN